MLENGVGAAGGALRNGGSEVEGRPMGAAATLRGFVRPSKVRAMLAMRACRSSIMIGRALDKPQMRQVRCPGMKSGIMAMLLKLPTVA